MHVTVMSDMNITIRLNSFVSCLSCLNAHACFTVNEQQASNFERASKLCCKQEPITGNHRGGNFQKSRLGRLSIGFLTFEQFLSRSSLNHILCKLAATSCSHLLHSDYVADDFLEKELKITSVKGSQRKKPMLPKGLDSGK